MELKNNTLFKETCFIGGKWIESDTGEKIKVDNPANGEIIGEVPKCSTSETQKAIQEAQAAFPLWRDKTAKERSVILQKWARLIEANADDLAKIMTIEQGKPLAEAKGEILMGVTYIDFYAEEGKRVYGDIIPDPMPDRRIVVIKQPVGVVGAITPWNFPSTMITRKCAPALARAGAHFLVIIVLGKFHGVIAPTTPTGCFMTTILLSGIGSGIISP